MKVCSAVSSACSGAAILRGLEWAADPNGDGETSDHMNVVNMSLGLSYGQNYDDDSSIAVDNLMTIGAMVVISAGNSARKPSCAQAGGAAHSANTRERFKAVTVPRIGTCSPGEGIKVSTGRGILRALVFHRLPNESRHVAYTSSHP